MSKFLNHPTLLRFSRHSHGTRTTPSEILESLFTRRLPCGGIAITKSWRPRRHQLPWNAFGYEFVPGAMDLVKSAAFGEQFRGQSAKDRHFQARTARVTTEERERRRALNDREFARQWARKARKEQLEMIKARNASPALTWAASASDQSRLLIHEADLRRLGMETNTWQPQADMMEEARRRISIADRAVRLTARYSGETTRITHLCQPASWRVNDQTTSRAWTEISRGKSYSGRSNMYRRDAVHNVAIGDDVPSEGLIRACTDTGFFPISEKYSQTSSRDSDALIVTTAVVRSISDDTPRRNGRQIRETQHVVAWVTVRSTGQAIEGSAYHVKPPKRNGGFPAGIESLSDARNVARQSALQRARGAAMAPSSRQIDRNPTGQLYALEFSLPAGWEADAERTPVRLHHSYRAGNCDTGTDQFRRAYRIPESLVAFNGPGVPAGMLMRTGNLLARKAAALAYAEETLIQI